MLLLKILSFLILTPKLQSLSVSGTVSILQKNTPIGEDTSWISFILLNVIIKCL